MRFCADDPHTHAHTYNPRTYTYTHTHAPTPTRSTCNCPQVYVGRSYSSKTARFHDVVLCVCVCVCVYAHARVYTRVCTHVFVRACGGAVCVGGLWSLEPLSTGVTYFQPKQLAFMLASAPGPRVGLNAPSGWTRQIQAAHMRSQQPPVAKLLFLCKACQCTHPTAMRGRWRERHGGRFLQGP